MNRLRNAAWCLSAITIVALALNARAQTPQTESGKPEVASRSEQVSRVTIEVFGGEKETPIENASIYLKYVEEHKIKKDRKVELNVKTNRDGAAHIPAAPQGRVLIQVVADGWKTYGRWYDITDPKQTIKVHLEKPPRWY